LAPFQIFHKNDIHIIWAEYYKYVTNDINIIGVHYYYRTFEKL